MAFKYLVPAGFEHKVRNFPEEAYDVTDVNTHIFKYMWTLLEVGVKFLETIQQLADENQNSLSNSKWDDLDLFNFLGLTRLNEEAYTYDPYLTALKLPTWRELFTKDSLFRTRIIRFANAVQRGGTPEGIKLMAEAACGNPCQVYEYWRKDNATDVYADIIDDASRLKVDSEFIIMPLFPITPNHRAVIFHMLELIQPVGTICSIAEATPKPYVEIRSQWAASSTHYYECYRRVTSDSSIPARPGGWLTPNTTVDAPVWALKSTQDYTWSYNADVISTNAFELTDTYNELLGSLSADILSTDTDIIVTESIKPTFSAFYAKIDNEHMYISNRRLETPGSPGVLPTFKYSVTRGQIGTIKTNHSSGSLVLTNAHTAAGFISVETTRWSGWITIPLADAHDSGAGINHNGQLFPGSSGKMSATGKYIYDWPSQAAYVQWIVNQVLSAGGEVQGNTYRLRAHDNIASEVSSSPTDAMAPPPIRITNRAYPV